MSKALRIVLVAAVLGALAANILWRIPWGSMRGPTQAEIEHAQTWDVGNILPTASNLRAMQRQWKERIAALPPGERGVSEARLQEETRFFMQAQLLPAAERKKAVRQRIESLMNDPGIQADWAAERMKIFAATSPERRRELLKKYVEFKKQRGAGE